MNIDIIKNLKWFALAVLGLCLALVSFTRAQVRRLQKVNISPHKVVPLWVNPARAGVLCLLFLTWLLTFQTARAQVTPTTLIKLTNLPPVIIGGTTSNLFTNGTGYIPTNNVIPLRQGTGFASQLTGVGTNAATTNGLLIQWAVTIDGTNYFAPPYLMNSNNMAGTNVGINATNFPGVFVNNMLYATPLSISSTNASTNTITNVAGEVGLGNIVPGGFGN